MDGKTLSRDPEHTRRQLKMAAQHEFNSVGYFFTDTNKIARAAGYAPGSFYRHFKDKVEVFIEVYRDWHLEQMNAIEKTLHEEGDKETLSARLTFVILTFYTKWKTFRASARVLAISEERVRTFKKDRRVEIVHAIIGLRKKLNFAPKQVHEVVTFLIELEHLCDAIADGEYQQFDIPVEVSAHELETLLYRFLEVS
jgi:AcrR family transcriptional regulator